MRNDWITIRSEADLPTRSGDYAIIDRRDSSFKEIYYYIANHDNAYWLENIIAYLPEPLPDYETD